MTELQLGLIGLGVAAICAVVIYNKWQERKHRALAERVLGTPSADVLLDRTREESTQPRDGDLPFDEPVEEPRRVTTSAPVFEDEPVLGATASITAKGGSQSADADIPPPGLAARLSGRFGFGRKKTPAIESAMEPATALGAATYDEPRIEPALADASTTVEMRREPAIAVPAHLPDDSARFASDSCMEAGSPKDADTAVIDSSDTAAEPLPSFLHQAAVDVMNTPSTMTPIHPSRIDGLETQAGVVASSQSASAVSIAPAVTPSLTPPTVEPRPDARREGGGQMLLTPLIDYVASFETVEPVSAQMIIEVPAAAMARLRKAVLRVGYNEQNHEWETIDGEMGGEYRRFRIGLQLVDRQGPVSEAELSVFHMAMQDLADATLAIIELPPRSEALSSAAELDAFCAGVDIQIGINVVSQAQTFPGTKLRALAEAAGMMMDVEGRFVRRDDDGNVLYVLINQEAQPFAPETMRTLSTHGLTFLFDVPCVPHGERVFNQMVDLAKRFSDVLRGVVVDDNRRPLSESALEPIRKQLVQYQAMLASRRLPAGSAVTRRLFS